MRTVVGLATAGWILLALGVMRVEAVGCLLPPRVVRAAYDMGGARYEWTTTCGERSVVIRGSYDDRTNQVTQVVLFPHPRRAANVFELHCARNPWVPGDRFTCRQVRATISEPVAFSEPWLGAGVLEDRVRRALPPAAQRGSPTPLLPPDGAALPRPHGQTSVVELRWTSSAGPAVAYLVEVERGVSARGPWRRVDLADVHGRPELSVGYVVPADLFADGAYRHWRWRVAQNTDGRTRWSAWQAFSVR
jgi:hypothetical protein